MYGTCVLHCTYLEHIVIGEQPETCLLERGDGLLGDNLALTTTTYARPSVRALPNAYTHA